MLSDSMCNVQTPFIDAGKSVVLPHLKDAKFSRRCVDDAWDLSRRYSSAHRGRTGHVSAVVQLLQKDDGDFIAVLCTACHCWLAEAMLPQATSAETAASFEVR